MLLLHLSTLKFCNSKKKAGISNIKWVLLLTMRGSTAGIDDNLKGTSKAHFLFLTVLDTLLSSIVIGPAIIAYWRGTWCLIDIYIFPDNVENTIISSSVIGLVGHLVFTISQNHLKNHLHPEKHRLLYYTASRFYTYVYGIACVNLWRGAWKALDHYTGTETLTVIIPTVVSAVALAGMRTFRNLSGAPFGVVLDICQGYFEVPTMFRLVGAGDTSLYILDCFFSVFVVGSLVVFVWRGLWVLTDTLCYPDDDNLSAISSLIIGYAIVIVTFSLQSPMKKLCEKLTGFWRILAVDIYIAFSFVGTINLWRGIWNLLNIYFLPESPAMSCWITHLGCFVFLVLINCSNSILVRGVYIDAEEEGGKCVVFPTYYLRFFVQERRKKKIQKNQKNHTITTITSKGEYEKSEKITKEILANHNDVSKNDRYVTVDLPLETGSKVTANVV